MTTTPKLGITLIEQSQSQKEVTANTAFARLDAMQAGVLDKDLSTPPGSPAEGDSYIVGASATGDWTGKEKQIAYYSSGWQFISPVEGMTLWVVDEFLLYSYSSGDWVQSVGYIGLDMQFNTVSNARLQNYSEKVATVAAAATTALDLESGNLFKLTQDTDISTLTFDNPTTSGNSSRFTLVRIKDATATARTISWPASVQWAGGSAPTLTQTSGAVDIFDFFTIDAGTSWHGRIFGLDMQ